ncbi:substrate binding domain-containing protein, partial [Aeromonas veronii]|uniref:substrate binding domain-containing protein n=1 Tax=Aeromonas veronii TaxID=654 RepID=UPI0035BA80A3
DLQLTPRWVDLVEEGFDAAIRTLRPQDEVLIARPLLTQHYRLCAAPDYLNRHGVPRHPADLARHQCLHGNWGEHERWQFVGEDGQSEEVRVASRLRINHWPALLTAALSGAGITLQPAEQVSDHIAAGRLLPLLGRYQSPAKTLYFIYPAARICSLYSGSGPACRDSARKSPNRVILSTCRRA